VQRSVIQGYTGTAEGNIYSASRRINTVFMLLGKGCPGVKQDCRDQDKIVYFIHFLSISP
jgi:hypothetical protein